jgi:hypothetical protein
VSLIVTVNILAKTLDIVRGTEPLFVRVINIDVFPPATTDILKVDGLAVIAPVGPDVTVIVPVIEA